ncbi:hypothetical protein [Streptomyces brasiliensis]|uniref:hypothetical protein n=1 Tax=Streptomyces brasiliensis TaxID=1954 RepID=UPI001E5616C8|nr:hypothetical protein [Streptomyces brasiliensis]
MFARKHDPDVSEQLLAAVDGSLGAYERLIAEAQERGEIVAGAPERIALFAAAGLHGPASFAANGTARRGRPRLPGRARPPRPARPEAALTRSAPVGNPCVGSSPGLHTAIHAPVTSRRPTPLGRSEVKPPTKSTESRATWRPDLQLLRHWRHHRGSDRLGHSEGRPGLHRLTQLRPRRRAPATSGARFRHGNHENIVSTSHPTGPQKPCQAAREVNDGTTRQVPLRPRCPA